MGRSFCRLTHDMKPLLLLLMFPALWISAVPGTGGDGKTSGNLQAAYREEMAATATYAAFAEQATKDNLPLIALLFTAASRSEAVHAANYRTILEKKGIRIPESRPEFAVLTTKENLETAVSQETKEIQEIYPGYITTAKQESEMNALKTLRWAMETEKRHAICFRNALAALNGGFLDNLPKVYWVCPKCGNTYDVPDPENMCSLCGTMNTRFIRIGTAAGNLQE